MPLQNFVLLSPETLKRWKQSTNKVLNDLFVNFFQGKRLFNDPTLVSEFAMSERYLFEYYLARLVELHSAGIGGDSAVQMLIKEIMELDIDDWKNARFYKSVLSTAETISSSDKMSGM